jgi:hypothetical protein
MRVLFGFVLSVCLCNAAADRVPEFKDYAVSSLFRGSPAKPRFANPGQVRANGGYAGSDELPDADERYRGSVESDAQRGPNFAGRFTIALFSCGPYCASMVVVDARTGALYRKAPFGTLDTLGNPQSMNHEYEGLSFRKDSSLLIVEGCFDTDLRSSQGKPPDCSRSYYRWVAPRFKLLRKIRLPGPLD